MYDVKEVIGPRIFRCGSICLGEFQLCIKVSLVCNRYHQKVPLTAPDLELKATYGLVQPEEFKLPEPNALWTKQTYGLFDLTQKAEETVS